MTVNGKQPYKEPPQVLHGYVRVVRGDVGRAEAHKFGLWEFCRANGFMLGTVFTDWGVEDSDVARPGFSSLLDVCRFVGSGGVVVPAKTHLSSHERTLETLTLQLKRIGAKLIAVDEVAATGQLGINPDKGTESVARGVEP
jgi:DNA invertase Pin-like site-specific DNA recombinase